LLTPPFTYRGGVLLGRQLRVLCLETELEKRKKKSGVSMSLTAPLDKGDRVRTRQRIGRLACSMFIVLVRMCGGTVLGENLVHLFFFSTKNLMSHVVAWNVGT